MKIDAYLESNRVTNELYREVHVLYQKLIKEGHHVSPYEIKIEHDIEEAQLESVSRGLQVKEVLDKLSALKKFITPLQVLSPDESIYTPLQIYVIRNMADLHRYIDRDKL